MIFVRRSNITTLLTLIFILIAIANSSTDGENNEKIKNIPVETISETLPEALLNAPDDIKEVEEKVEKDVKENVDSALKKLKEEEKDRKTFEDVEGKELVKEVEGSEKTKIEPITEISEKSDDAEEKSESPESASPNSKEESEPSIEFEKAPENAYAVWNSKGKICLLAKLNATFVIVYNRDKDEDEEKTEVTITHGVAEGTCESPLHSPLLKIIWDKFNFTMMFNKSDEENWIVTSLELSYDTFGVLFDGATNAGKINARSKAVGLFETPIDKSYFCAAPEVVSLFKGNKQVVTATLKNIHLQPYGVEDGKFSRDHRCNKVLIDSLGETPYEPDETVPLAVGCTLALITLCILIGFAVHRAYNAAKVDYNNMDP